MFTLGEPSILEGVFKAAGFLDIVIHAVPVLRQYASTSEAIRALKNPFLQQLLDKLNEAEREQAWAEIEQQLSRFDGPNGFEVRGEMLIGVGTK